MEQFIIEGGHPLSGTIKAAGNKNAVLKMIPACILTDEPITLTNVPNIGDVEITVNLCKEIGSEVKWDKKNKILEICTPDLKTSYVPQRYSGSNRIPILMIGALLGRTDEDIIIPTVGGCDIGSRHPCLGAESQDFGEQRGAARGVEMGTDFVEEQDRRQAIATFGDELGVREHEAEE